MHLEPWLLDHTSANRELATYAQANLAGDNP